MPIYEYICQECDTRFERIVLSRGETITCPRCSSPRNALQLSVFSAPAKSTGPALAGNGSAGAGPCCGGGGCGCN